MRFSRVFCAASATANVETTLTQGGAVTINGNGFDVTNGVAGDVFCAWAGGKLPTVSLNTGNPDIKFNSVTFTLPASAPPGPASRPPSMPGTPCSFTGRGRWRPKTWRAPVTLACSAARPQSFRAG